MSTALRRLRSIGLTVEPYIVYLEPFDESGPMPDDSYVVTVIEADDIDTIVHTFLDEKRIWKKTWLRRLNNDEIGLALADRQGTVGFTWANIRYCTDPLGQRLFSLKDEEAYLHDMVISQRSRGRDLAGCLRAAMHRQLQSRGRTTGYSISSYFNTPAVRFKEKLNSIRIELRCSVVIARKNFDFRLRRYSQQARQFDYIR